MNDGRSLDTALGGWLNQQRELAQALLDSQSRLKAAIQEGRSEQIEAESRTQAEHLKSMESGRPVLAALLRQAGFNDDTAGLEAAIAAADERLQPLLEKTWQALRKDLRQVRDSNQRNSLLAGQHQKAITRSLLLLSGQDKPQPGGYDPKGRQAAAGISRYIGIA